MTPPHPLDTFRYCPRCGSAQFEVYDKRAKRCAACGFTFYANASTSTVAVIINRRGEILATRRAFEPAKGTLDLPGGFVDPGETAHEGVVREVREELGVQARAGELLFSLPNAYPYSGHTVHTCDLFFRVHIDEDAALRAHDDASETLWIPLHEVRPELFGLTSIRLGVEKILRMF